MLVAGTQGSSQRETREKCSLQDQTSPCSELWENSKFKCIGYTGKDEIRRELLLQIRKFSPSF